MELLYAIGEYLNVPQEWVNITRVDGPYVWFNVRGQANYTCKMVRGKFLAKNSIRVDS